MFPSTLLFFLCGLAVANAQAVTNDWSVPCHTGSCSYDIPATGSGYGSVHISGSSTAISDITTASGWSIIDCDPTALSQSIRLVCHNVTAGCDHVESGAGAAGKLVRLPEDCGAGPFARVASMSVASDQSVPSAVSARFARRAAPQVKSIVLDTNYTAIDPRVAGPISFTFVGNNSPSTIGATKHKRRSFLGDLGNNIQSAAGTVANSISSVAGNVASAAGNAVNAVGGALSAANNVNLDKSDPLPPITFDKTVNLVNIHGSCGPVNAQVTADLEGKANAVVTLNVKAAGTIVPPDFTSFSMETDMDATLNGLLTINADASATASSGQITLFTVGIPGLDIPGIFTLGPSFNIDASLDATLELGLNMQVSLNYQVQGLKASIPPSSDTAGVFAPLDTPLKLSATPEVAGKLSVTAHMIPNLKFGINVLDNTANVDAFLSLDASATLSGNFDATLGNNSSTATATDGAATATATDDAATASTTDDTATATATDDAATATATDDAATASATATDDAEFPTATDDSELPTATDDSEFPTSTDDADVPTATDGGEFPTDDSDSNIDDDNSDTDDSDSTTDDDNSATDVDNSVTDDSTDGDDSVADDSTEGSSSDDDSATATDNADFAAPTDDAFFKKRSYMGAKYAPSYKIALARSAALEAAELASRDIPITGCVSVDGAFDVNIGANGKLFNIINKNFQNTLFSKTFNVFNKCFNGAIPTRREVAAPVARRSVPRRSQLMKARAANALTCSPFTTSGTTPSLITDSTASAGDLLKTAK